MITSNTSSLPEVAADAAYLIDPMDVQEIAHAMERLAEDDTLHESLADKGLVRAQWFYRPPPGKTPVGLPAGFGAMSADIIRPSHPAGGCRG